MTVAPTCLIPTETKLWDLYVEEVWYDSPYYNGYWYVVDEDGKLMIVKDGSVVKEISYGESALDTAVCGKYLAVSACCHLYLYDLSDPANPREIWRVGGFDWAWQLAFSPNCKYILVVDSGHNKLKLFDIEKGDKILERKYKTEVISIALNGRQIAVGASSYLYIYHIPPSVHCYDDA